MSKRYDLIVFDWEGTIAEDGFGQIVSALALEAKKMHLAEFDKTLARRYIGLGVHGAIKQLFQDTPLYQQEQLSVAVQAAISSPVAEIVLVMGAKHTIERLANAGLKLAIATNKGHASLIKALQFTGLTDYFLATRSASQAPAKPCPQMLEELLLETNTPPQATLMIGDSVSDIQMANALGVDAVGVDFYKVARDELLAAGAADVFSTYDEVDLYLNVSGDNHGVQRTT